MAVELGGLGLVQLEPLVLAESVRELRAAGRLESRIAVGAAAAAVEPIVAGAKWPRLERHVAVAGAEPIGQPVG